VCYNLPVGADGFAWLQTTMKKTTFTAIVQREESGWIALCPELDVASQGDTIEAAKASLQEAVELFLETADPAEVGQRLRTETYLSQVEVDFG
jgi:predicted RNase H-like HicB family nuclease